MKHNLEKQSHFLCETSSWILTCIFGNLVPPNSSYSPFFIPDALLTSTVLLSQHLAPPDFLRGTEMSWVISVVWVRPGPGKRRDNKGARIYGTRRMPQRVLRQGFPVPKAHPA